MKRRNALRLALFVALAALLASGCAKKPTATEAPVSVEQPAEDAGGTPEAAVTEAPVEEVAPQPEPEPTLQPIRFEFDQYTLTPHAQDILVANAAYLKSHPEIKVIVEGYSDERGSDEYNLALGERRAVAAKTYLVSLGVDPDGLSTITYGEEKPFAPGHNEEAWAMNRRAEFNITR